MRLLCLGGLALSGLIAAHAESQEPKAPSHPIASPAGDWLVDATPFRGRVQEDGDRLVLDNGCLRATVRLRPDAALVALEVGPMREAVLRGPRPFARLWLGGDERAVGGLEGQRDHAFLTEEQEGVLTASERAFRCTGHDVLPMSERLAWPEAARRRATAAPVVWPPSGLHVVLHFAAPSDLPAGLAVDVHLELFDGLPLLSQWFELRNGTDQAIELDRFTALQWAVVEAESRVEPERVAVRVPNVHVETDFAFHAMTGADGGAHCVRWLADPLYETQVNYERRTRCLLEVGPDLGPAQTIAPGSTFRSFRTFALCHGEHASRDREALSLARMYRTLAPWTAENPTMLHLRTSEPASVRAAVDQCAEAGFELVILSFGSGFDIEDDSEANLARWKELADYAHGRGVQIGGYSLLSSRRIEPDSDNCLSLATGKPGGQVFGHAPALASAWGQRYFQKLRAFFERTGFDCLEHDGSYPGDADAAARPPLQKGHADSQWVQHAIVADFYRWCRARGIYLNVPDWYFLNGSNKTGMGYRETNWSLPRELQALHTRQNLFDGTRHKSPSMGWMFVPLSEYHGGGAAATIEPLHQHLDHYERMLQSNLGYGAQACWRGPRLFDTPATLAVVKRAVAFFRAHQRALEAPVVHGSSRRACGRDLDWVLHADPGGPEPAFVCVWNPTAQERRAELPLDLSACGLAGSLRVRIANGAEFAVAADGGSRLRLPVAVAPGGFSWYSVRAGE